MCIRDRLCGSTSSYAAIIYEASARRPCCAERRPGGSGGAEPPPGKSFCAKHCTYACQSPVHYGKVPWNKSQSLMGKRLCSGRAAIYPPAFSSLCPVHLFLPGDAGRPRRGNNNNNYTMALPMGPVPSIAAREFPLNRSGSPPSL